LHILRTYLEFLEANLTSDKKFNIPACNIQFFQIQGFCVKYEKPENSTFRPDIDAGRGWSGSMTFCVIVIIPYQLGRTEAFEQICVLQGAGHCGV
jgi:hypothetical protein